MADYTRGTADPVIHADPGAGVWNSRTRTASMWALKRAILRVLPHAYVVIGPDAASHMAHYLGNTGADYTIRLSNMVRDVSSAGQLYDREVALARRYVETLAVGAHNITSRSASNGYCHKEESWNWYYATGGHSVWGKGVARVGTDDAGRRGYSMEFEYKFFDRYNWDTGKSVTIFGVQITDQFMGDFHRQGLAREFDMNGSMTRTVQWGAPSAIPAAPAVSGRS